MSRLRLATLAASLSCALLVAVPTAVRAQGAAGELQEITRLYRQGQNDRAVERIDAYLAGKGKDQTPEIAQARFLKGLILAEQGKNADAILIFTRLTEEYPELPEPYNNLGVLYASQGQFEKSKLALEMAISTHPSYATAHENLGDIYARMASQAYDKALQLDKSNTTAQTKLALIKELVLATGKANRAAVAKPDASKAPTIASASTAPVKAATPPAPTPIPPAPVVTPPPAPSAAAVSPTAVPPPAKAPDTRLAPDTRPAPAPSVAASGSNESDVLKSVNGWAKAWSTKNVPAYLGYYASGFRVPGGENRAAWEKTRADRITKPKRIDVVIGSPSVTFVDATHAEVSFRQGYRSDVLSSSTSKTIDLVKVGDKWLIEQERIGR